MNGWLIELLAKTLLHRNVIKRADIRGALGAFQLAFGPFRFLDLLHNPRLQAIFTNKHSSATSHTGARRIRVRLIRVMFVVRIRNALRWNGRKQRSTLSAFDLRCIRCAHFVFEQFGWCRVRPVHLNDNFELVVGGNVPVALCFWGEIAKSQLQRRFWDQKRAWNSNRADEVAERREINVNWTSEMRFDISHCHRTEWQRVLIHYCWRQIEFHNICNAYVLRWSLAVSFSFRWVSTSSLIRQISMNSHGFSN